MSWRTVVVTKPSKLDYTMGYMTVRDVDNTVKIHLSEISILIVENTACSITCALLSELTLKKIKVIFCDAKRNPQSELISYYGSHDCSQKLKNQIAWNEISKQPKPGLHTAGICCYGQESPVFRYFPKQTPDQCIRQKQK